MVSAKSQAQTAGKSFRIYILTHVYTRKLMHVYCTHTHVRARTHSRTHARTHARTRMTHLQCSHGNRLFGNGVSKMRHQRLISGEELSRKALDLRALRQAKVGPATRAGKYKRVNTFSSQNAHTHTHAESDHSPIVNDYTRMRRYADKHTSTSESV